MNRNQFTRWRNYQKVLMAVYWLSEPDGLRCYATWRELSAETGLYIDTVKFYIGRLESRGVVCVPAIRDRPQRRTLVLLDHPDADEYLRQLTRPNRSTGRQSGERMTR